MASAAGSIESSLAQLQKELVMIEPYQAVGLIQTMRGIRRREDIRLFGFERG